MVGDQLRVTSFAERELALTTREVELSRRAHQIEQGEEGARQLLAEAFAERELELATHEAELARREQHAVRAEEALTTQRAQLETVRGEYESRLDLLTARTRELDGERDRLRMLHAQLRTLSLQLDERERAVASAAAEATLVEPPPRSAPPAPAPPVAAAAAAGAALPPPSPELFVPASVDDTDWWAKQLGPPREAA